MLPEAKAARERSHSSCADSTMDVRFFSEPVFFDRSGRDRSSFPSASRLHLFHGALPGLLVRTPAKKLCSVTKAAAGEMVILKFAHKFGLERDPFGVAFIASPTAGTTRSFAGEAALAWPVLA